MILALPKSDQNCATLTEIDHGRVLAAARVRPPAALLLAPLLRPATAAAAAGGPLGLLLWRRRRRLVVVVVVRDHPVLGGLALLGLGGGLGGGGGLLGLGLGLRFGLDVVVVQVGDVLQLLGRFLGRRWSD